MNATQLWAKFQGCTRHAQIDDGPSRALFDAMQSIDSLSGADAIALPA